MKDAAILDERNFITPREFSEIFDHQISVSTVNVLIRDGKIPVSKLGRKNLIPVSFVRAELSKGVQ